MAKTSISSGQRREVCGFVSQVTEQVVRELGLDREGMQRLIKSAGDLKTALHDPLTEVIRQFSIPSQFADEEVASNYVYGSGYTGPKPIAEQAAMLRAIWPHLRSCNEALATKPAPQGMEGYFAIPHWSLIAPTYKEAVEKVMAAISTTRKFHNYRKDQLGPQQLRETKRKAEAVQKLREEQKGNDILVVAGQFGRRHAGKSVRRTRVVFRSTEFGFGAYENGILLLTHPERLADFNDLWIDCAGDEAAPRAGEVFSECPYWHFYDDEFRFSFSDVGSAFASYGSSSGSPPEYES